MPDSMITQCPKCSTAFRVSADVLTMAKGKVRCGQCFHIFEAQSHATQTLDSTASASDKTPTANNKTKSKKTTKAKPKEAAPKEAAPKGHSPNLFTAADDDDIVNPDWLNTLISDDDLETPDNSNKTSDSASEQPSEDKTRKVNAKVLKAEKEPAPWELELAELEAAQSQAKSNQAKSKTSTQVKSTLSMDDDDFFLDAKTLTSPQKPQTTASSKQAVNTNESPTKPAAEPEYMQALQELAQSVSQQEGSNSNQGLQFNHDVSHNLGELMDDPEDNGESKPKHTWRWALACFALIIISAVQLIVVNYETGSRSASFRPIYNIVCSYYGCVLPIFEDVKAIDIQHVRVQSHPTKENALVVNAIMTNHSNFSQPMPKIAMEFYDLNGSPVAARLFSQKDFLDKDFLDITYMPPKTPIHLVIPIADPGATAVTHKLKVYRAETRSY